MRKRHTGRWIFVAAALLGVLAPASKARACVTGEMLLLGAAAALAPSDLGVASRAADGSSARLVIGWSWQIPIADGASIAHPERHRIVPAIDLLPRSGGAAWRGRLGYRYGRRHLFGGAGVGVDGAGPNLSPELGVKFLHGHHGDGDDYGLSLHLLARAEIALQSGQVRGATILLGWNLF